MAINPHLYANPGYNPLTDLAPVTRLGVGPQALAVHKDVPARSLEELLALARAKPGELTFVTPGVGTPGHLAACLLMHLTGIKATHIPYKGGGQAVQDLIAGHVTFTIEGLTLLRPFVKDGRLRALAVTTSQRAKSMPDVLTMAGAGVPGYELTAWAGIAAPAGTPRPVIDRLYGEIATIVATAEARAWFELLRHRCRRRAARCLCCPRACRIRPDGRGHRRHGHQSGIASDCQRVLHFQWLAYELRRKRRTLDFGFQCSATIFH